ncbi:phospho-sugar mutase [Actinospongicola halichondriae]|uniref:phospho-sugar mutase n=1 Tax=Actinospongicola halichondriae TaxID=3236844 RepID=UPI003D37350D
MIDPALRTRAEAWRDDDPDPETVAEIDRLLAKDDDVALRARFDRPLTFGTAGLRGALGAGPGRMNRAVVRTTAAAICAWLDQRRIDGPVVVGRDARHGSAAFAEDTVRIVAATGRQALWWPDPVPTPLLAFAVLDAGAAAGVMVTASHNPPQDNGYKVYAAHGAQIAPPDDADIAVEIARVGRVHDIPLADLDSALVGELPDEMRDRYLAGVAAARVRPATPPLTAAYTPMHGVGGETLRQAFAAAGLDAPVVVAEQAEPDPDFPTVAFPNPEEPGAMDLVIALATAVDADVALANDPDADRLAVAVPTSDGWRALTGDEVGVLLADHLLRHGAGGADRLVATTVVSSSLLARLAQEHGVDFAETLTGFKWLAQASRGRDLVLAYEEALGYCVGNLVHDKDGISAAVVFTELVGALRSEGSSVRARLDEIARRHGLHLTAQWSTRFEGLDGAALMAEKVAALRSDPPTSLGWTVVTSTEDLLADGPLPPTDAVVLRGAGVRVVVRPSGTEPKLKAYVELVVPVDGPVDGARAEGRRQLGELLSAVAALLS